MYIFRVVLLLIGCACRACRSRPGGGSCGSCSSRAVVVVSQHEGWDGIQEFLSHLVSCRLVIQSTMVDVVASVT